MTKFKLTRGKTLKIEQIEPNPWNINETNQRQQEAIGESLDYYGQIQEILVRPHPEKKDAYQIIDGEHRYLELKEKETSINVNILDIDEIEAKKLSIILNETRGQANHMGLGALLSELEKELGESTIIGLPYTQDEFKEFISLDDFDWDSFENEEQPLLSDEEEKEEEIETIGIVLDDKTLAILDEKCNKPRTSLKPLIYGQVIADLINNHLV